MDDVSSDVINRIIDAIKKVLRHGFGRITIEIRNNALTSIKVTYDEKV